MSNKIDKSEFEEIYVKYFSRMVQFTREYVLSSEDAKNIVQDVFTELWEHRETMNVNINIIAYLFATLKNRCIDFLRHKIIIQDTADKIQENLMRTFKMKCDSLEYLNQDLFDESNIEKRIDDAINSLPERCREIFMKNKFDGKKQKDIAVELNISLSTVESQMTMAYKKLREELKDIMPLFLFLFYL